MVDARVLTAALVVVAVLALGVTAAGVDSVDPNTEQQPQQPDETPSSTPARGDPGGSDLSWCPGPLQDWRLLAGVVLALGLGGAFGYRRTGSVLLPALVVTPTLLYLVVACGGGLPAVGPVLDLIGDVLAAVFGAPLLLFGGLVLALGGAVALLYVRSEAGAFGAGDEWEAEATEEGDLEAVGEAAGAAADRIEGQADVSNEVYRAWAEMTQYLDVAHPETTAPDEFAEAAVAAGMAEDDVATLTRLFQDVRYGGADADARADEAVEALRGIERTYGGDES